MPACRVLVAKMVDAELDIEMPVLQYNFIMVFVCTFVLLWAFHALGRFSRTLLIRLAALDDRLVAVNGLGNSLLYFEQATRAHIEAVAHMRKAKPAQQMKSSFLPYSIDNVSLVLDSDRNLHVEIKMWLGVRCFVFVLVNVDVNKLKGGFESQVKVRSKESGGTVNAMFLLNGQSQLVGVKHGFFTEPGFSAGVTASMSLEAGSNVATFPVNLLSLPSKSYTQEGETNSADKDVKYAVFVVPTAELDDHFDARLQLTLPRPSTAQHQELGGLGSGLASSTSANATPRLDFADVYSATDGVSRKGESGNDIELQALSITTPSARNVMHANSQVGRQTFVAM